VIVLDASAALEVLLQTASAEAVMKRIFRPAESLHAPHLLDLEVAQVLRRYTRNRSIAEERAALALDDFAEMSIERYPHDLLLPRIWELRENFTAYDAAYIALAELLSAPLLTLDSALESRLHRARVERIGA
jgi:predicted nucleic acid-binding protein